MASEMPAGGFPPRGTCAPPSGAFSRAYEHFLRRRLFSIIGRGDVCILPNATTVKYLSPGQHQARKLVFGLDVVVLVVVGMIVLEVFKGVLNELIPHRRRAMKAFSGWWCEICRNCRSWCEMCDVCGETAYGSSSRCLRQGSQAAVVSSNRVPLLGNSASQSSSQAAAGVASLGAEVVDVEAARLDEEAEREARSKEDEALERRNEGLDAQDLYFEKYSFMYKAFCLFVVAYACNNDFLSDTAGMDYELYLPWICATVLIHIVCLFLVFLFWPNSKTPLPGTLSVIPNSIFNPFSVHFCVMRDSVVAGVYLQHALLNENPWFSLLALIQVLTLVLPGFCVVRDMNPLRDYQAGLWPIVINFERVKLEEVRELRGKPQKAMTEEETTLCFVVVDIVLGIVTRSVLACLHVAMAMAIVVISAVALTLGTPIGIPTVFAWRVTRCLGGTALITVPIAVLVAMVLAFCVATVMAKVFALCGFAMAAATVFVAIMCFAAGIIAGIAVGSPACTDTLQQSETWLLKTVMEQQQYLVKTALEQADRQTRKQQQDVALWGDIPKLVAGLVFWKCSSSPSVFVLFVSVLCLVKALVVLSLRQHILDWLAAHDMPWTRLSRSDLQRVVCCKKRCGRCLRRSRSWTHYIKAFRTLLEDEDTPSTVREEVMKQVKIVMEGGGARALEAEKNRLGCAILREIAKQPEQSDLGRSAELAMEAIESEKSSAQAAESVEKNSAWTEVVPVLRRLESSYTDNLKSAANRLTTELTNKDSDSKKAWAKYGGAFVGNLVSAMRKTLPPKRECILRGLRDEEEKFAEDAPQRQERIYVLKTEMKELEDAQNRDTEAYESTKKELNKKEKEEKEFNKITARIHAAKDPVEKDYLEVREARYAASRALGAYAAARTEAVRDVGEDDITKRALSDVCTMLGDSDPEVRSAALSTVVKYRGESEVKEAVEKALDLLKDKDCRDIAEIVLVNLLPRTGEQQKQGYVRTIVGVCESEDDKLSETAEDVLSRLGARAARVGRGDMSRNCVLDELSAIEGDLSARQQRLKRVVECQETCLSESAGDYTLFLGQAPKGNKTAVETILNEVGKGEEVFTILSRHAPDYARKLPRDEGMDDDVLLVFITDCEADDIMFMAELWKYLRTAANDSSDQPKCYKPLVVFNVNLEDKDAGMVFEKKMLLSALMLGPVDFYVLTPDPKVDFKRSAERHKLADKMAGLRRSNLEAIASKIKEFDQKEVRFYICAPGYGNLGALMEKFEPRSDKQKWKGLGSVHLYSGGYNVRDGNMTKKDLDALYKLVGKGGVVTDAAKHPFFGKDDSHEVVRNFATFALPSFSAKLTTEHPQIAAAWSSLDTEFNRRLVHPDKLSDDKKMLDESVYQSLKKQHKEVSTPSQIKEYAEKVIDETKNVWHKVKGQKRGTLGALACGSCDAPLCDQLIFLIEWAKDEQRKQRKVFLAEDAALEQAWVKSEEGEWSFNSRTGYTSVQKGPKKEGPAMRGTQPVMREPHDVEVLYKMREALEEYTLAHLKDLVQMEEAEAKAVRWFRFSDPDPETPNSIKPPMLDSRRSVSTP